MIRNCDKGHACIDGVPFQCPWCLLAVERKAVEWASAYLWYLNAYDEPDGHFTPDEIRQRAMEK